MSAALTERLAGIGESVSSLGDTVGHALGDAWSTGAAKAHDVVDAATDLATGDRGQRRRGFPVRRMLIALGLAATLGLVVLAFRRGREPSAATAGPGTRDATPGAPSTNATAAAQFAAAT